MRKTIVALLAALMLVFVPAVAAAEPAGASDINYYVCLGVSLGDASACNNDTSGETIITDLARNVINFLALIVGIVSVVMIIFGGFRYITSSGDDSKITSAKNTILYAIIGLLIAIFARQFVSFIISRFS